MQEMGRVIEFSQSILFAAYYNSDVWADPPCRNSQGGLKSMR